MNVYFCWFPAVFFLQNIPWHESSLFTAFSFSFILFNLSVSCIHPSWLLAGYLWLNTTACCIWGCETRLFSSDDDFLLWQMMCIHGKVGRKEEYPLFIRPMLRGELFLKFKHQEKTVCSVCHRETNYYGCITTLKLTSCELRSKNRVRSAAICVPVIRAKYSNWPDRERRES